VPDEHVLEGGIHRPHPFEGEFPDDVVVGRLFLRAQREPRDRNDDRFALRSLVDDDHLRHVAVVDAVGVGRDQRPEVLGGLAPPGVKVGVPGVVAEEPVERGWHRSADPRAHDIGTPGPVGPTQAADSELAGSGRAFEERSRTPSIQGVTG
jgi:hypothetical protein